MRCACARRGSCGARACRGSTCCQLRTPGKYGHSIVPAKGIELEGELKSKAEAIRDELTKHLKKKGTAGLPKTFHDGKVDLMGAWLAGANLSQSAWLRTQMRATLRAGTAALKSLLGGRPPKRPWCAACLFVLSNFDR